MCGLKLIHSCERAPHQCGAFNLLLSNEVRVRLTRKLAKEIDGVDLSDNDVGEVIDLPARKARLLIAERWAIVERRIDGPPEVIAFRRTSDPGHHHREDDDPPPS